MRGVAAQVAVEGGAGDPQRLADRGDIRRSTVVEGPGQGELLGLGQLLRPAARSAPRSRGR